MTSNNGVKEMVTPVTEYNPFELRTNTISADWWPDNLTVTVKERSFGESQDMQRDQMGGKMPHIPIVAAFPPPSEFAYIHVT